MIIVEAAADAAQISVEGLVDEERGDIRYLGLATRNDDGRWTALAIIGRTLLCRVELRVRPMVHVDRDLGDEDDRAEKMRFNDGYFSSPPQSRRIT